MRPVLVLTQISSESSLRRAHRFQHASVAERSQQIPDINAIECLIREYCVFLIDISLPYMYGPRRYLPFARARTALHL